MRPGAPSAATIAAAMLGFVCVAPAWARAHESASASSPACLRVLQPALAGTVPDSRAFEPAACSSDADATAFRHDPLLGFTRIVRSLAAGDIVHAYPEFDIAMVRPGETLHIVVASGPVRIVREVEAMQAARPGQRLFVKTADGQVLSATFEPVEP